VCVGFSIRPDIRTSRLVVFAILVKESTELNESTSHPGKISSCGKKFSESPGVVVCMVGVCG